MNSFPIITCHGLFGWAKGELPVDYWGRVSHTSPLPIFDVAVGPLSSWHDRACELIAQIKGLRVDYGASHAKHAGHKRFGRDYSGYGFHPAWQADNPVHLVGHSAGGNTLRMAQHLLATDHYKIGSNADWVKSITAISSVLNGTPVPYILGCDRETGQVGHTRLAKFLKRSISTLAKLQTRHKIVNYDFDLDHWGYTAAGDLAGDVDALHNIKLFRGNDNLFWDLTLHGSYHFNGFAKSYPNTYYFGFATEQTHRIGKAHFPSPRMNPMLWPIGMLHGRYNFDKHKPIPGWGSGRLVNHEWRSNDGLVPEISQYHPFINDAISHPLAPCPSISEKQEFSPGMWYYENVQKSTGVSFDHLDIICGSYLDIRARRVQQKFFTDLWHRLSTL